MKQSEAKNEAIKKFLEEIKDDGPLMIYRGQNEKFEGPPLTKLDRCVNIINKISKEPKNKVEYLEEMLTEFKNMSFQYLRTIEPKSEWEWLSLAQHYGLPTCFLDWTDNPIIAFTVVR